MRLRLFFLAGLLASILAGCVTVPPGSSYVAGVQPADATALSYSIVDYVKTSLLPAHSVIALVPAVPNQPDGGLSAALYARLLKAGYGVAQTGQGDHRLGYVVSPYEGGLLVRLTIDGVPAACLYTHDTAGNLVAISPYTARESTP